MRREYGIECIPGGVHPAWGTGNRIAPFGADYVELLGVVDPEQAARSSFGRRLLELTAQSDRWFTVCLADDDLDGTAARLGVEVTTGSRTRPDGRVVEWRSAALEDPRRDGSLPFFIEWRVPPELHPGRAAASHPSGATGIAWVEVAGDPDRVREWTGDAALPLRIVSGEPRVLAVGVSRADGGELVVR